jgi:bifunctional non-homologous end joining protein LigD
MMRKMHWVNSVFVCEIKFAEWTRDRKLRAPVFLGLREDKNPTDVVREV